MAYDLGHAVQVNSKILCHSVGGAHKTRLLKLNVREEP